jgi:hypothetical protein
MEDLRQNFAIFTRQSTERQLELVVLAVILVAFFNREQRLVLLVGEQRLAFI